MFGRTQSMLAGVIAVASMSNIVSADIHILSSVETADGYAGFNIYHYDSSATPPGEKTAWEDEPSPGIPPNAYSIAGSNEAEARGGFAAGSGNRDIYFIYDDDDANTSDGTALAAFRVHGEVEQLGNGTASAIATIEDVYGPAGGNIVEAGIEPSYNFDVTTHIPVVEGHTYHVHLNCSAAAFARYDRGWVWMEPSFGLSYFPVPGDLDGDRDVDQNDIDLQLHSGTAADLNGDTVTDGDDLTYLIETLLNTRLGDLDLDGDVDIADFNILAPHFGITSVMTYADGDLNGDGAVDIQDFNIFSPNFGWHR